MIVRQWRLELPYPPGTGNHSVRHVRGRHYLTAQAKAYRGEVAVAAHRAGMAGRKLLGPLRVRYVAAPPDRRERDSDNVEKPLKDALTKAGVWASDSNKVIRSSTFEWAEPMAGGSLLVVIEEA